MSAVCNFIIQLQATLRFHSLGVCNLIVQLHTTFCFLSWCVCSFRCFCECLRKHSEGYIASWKLLPHQTAKTHSHCILFLESCKNCDEIEIPLSLSMKSKMKEKVKSFIQEIEMETKRNEVEWMNVFTPLSLKEKRVSDWSGNSRKLSGIVT
jgi:hypothetical protein